MTPKKNRRAKLKRRKAYDAAVKRKHDLATRRQQLVAGFLRQQLVNVHKELYEARRQAHSYKEIIEGILHSRLVVDVAQEQKDIRARYFHPDTVYPLSCLKGLSHALVTGVPRDDFDRDRVMVNQFCAGVEGTYERMHSVRDLVQQFGELLANGIYKKLLHLAAEVAIYNEKR